MGSTFPGLLLKSTGLISRMWDLNRFSCVSTIQRSR